MKISQSWLSELIDLPWTGEELGRRLTAIGLPVDALETKGADLTNFVVGHVIEAGRHPNADKLTLCRVDVGTGEPLQIICGAPNAAVGVRGAVALIGAVLPDGTKIKKAKLRGVESQGMLCSERELGLSAEHAGIIDLGEGAPPPGTPLASILAAGDQLFELDIPSNRGDCFSHLGVARELSALTGNPVRLPASAVEESLERAGDLTTVAVDDPEGCPRYLARIVRGVKVGPSPAWLVKKLAAIGQRSISNVVDVTNLVLWEMGQPLHAFDFDTLRGRRIVVRRARAGENVVTLDGIDRALTPEVLVIADADRAVALAGIMGGRDTEVTDATNTILLEGAWFDPFRVLRGTRAVRLTTEASLRFVRGIDLSGTAAAIDRCARLLVETAGGEILGGTVDVTRAGFPKHLEVTWRPGAAERLLGEPIPDGEALALLERLGYRRVGGAPIVLAAPDHRLDVKQECDLVDDVARLRGFDAIGERSYNLSGLAATRSPLDLGIAKVRSAWLSLGFTEMLNKALVDPDDMARSGIPAAEIAARGILIPEPSSREEAALRMSLLPGALRSIAHNIRHGRPDLRLFEVGAVYLRNGGHTPASEPIEVVVAATGGDFGPDLTRLDPAMDASRFRGLVEAFLELLRVDTPQYRCYDGIGFQNSTSIVIESHGKPLGTFGVVAPEISEAFNVSRPIHLARFTMTDLLAAIPTELHYREPSRFPDSRRDLAFLVDDSIPGARVAETIRRFGGGLLIEATLFDRFTGKSLPEGKVSLAYALRFQASDRTLSDDEVRAAEKAIVDGLGREIGAVLRDR